MVENTMLKEKEINSIEDFIKTIYITIGFDNWDSNYKLFISVGNNKEDEGKFEPFLSTDLNKPICQISFNGAEISHMYFREKEKRCSLCIDTRKMQDIEIDNVDDLGNYIIDFRYDDGLDYHFVLENFNDL